MGTATRPMSVEEFRAFPENRRRYELRNGERVEVTCPKLKHALIQGSLRRLMEPLAEPASYVDTEVAFRPLPDFELRVADVAYIAAARFAAADPEDNFRGVPEIVIEVLSPSNNAGEIIEKQDLCLANGGKEFWVVEPERKAVAVLVEDRSCKDVSRRRIRSFSPPLHRRKRHMGLIAKAM